MKKLIDVMRRHLVVTMLVVFMAGIGACCGAGYVYAYEVLLPNLAEDFAKVRSEGLMAGYVMGEYDMATDSAEYFNDVVELYEDFADQEYHYITTK